MDSASKLIFGEHQRTLDERFRVSLPTEMSDALTSESNDCVIVKERPGCLSLWHAKEWKEKMNAGIAVIESKFKMGKLAERTAEVQKFSRLLSSRYKEIPMAGRGRFVLPEGFRNFLNVEAGGEVVVVGAGVSVELWNPTQWFSYLEEQTPEFQGIFDELTK